MFYLQLVLFVIFLFLIYKWSRPPKNLPPGEWGLPFVGILPYMGNLRRYFTKVKRTYGKIFYLKVGSRLIVFIRDFEIIKNHFNKSELLFRPYIYHYWLFNFLNNLGLIFSNGSIWEFNRRFSLRHLRDFGFGKSNKMQEIIFEEAKELVGSLENKVGEPIEIERSLDIGIVNVIWRLVAGKRLDANNERMKNYSKQLQEDEHAMDGAISLLSYFPALEPYVPKFVKRHLKVDQVLKNRMESKEFLEEIVEEHKKTLDSSSPRDYIDSYLIEMQENKELETLGDPILNLVCNIKDFFNAGMDTSSTTMRWFIMLMAAYPEVQKKVQEELDSVLPKNQIVLLEDKDKLPYLQATMNEVMRYRTLAPVSFVHTTQEDYQMEGYTIPKGSLIYPCTEACHEDPKYWDNPESFNPENFLNEDGSFKTITEAFIPFSYGKRSCIAESLARMEVFMFAGAIAQKYRVKFPEDEKIDMNPIDTVLVLSYPKPFKVILEMRN